MAKVSAREAVKRSKERNGNEFFTLENDMDTATVRFLYDTEDSLDIFLVHEVEIGGKKRYIDCLNTATCPLCKSGNRAKDKFFIQLVDSRDNKVKTWERGPQFIPKILGLFNRFGPICNRQYDIERHGVPRDTKTTYELFALDKDDKQLTDLPKKQDLVGTFILEKTEEEINEFLRTGNFPDAGQGSSNGGSHSQGGSQPQESQRRRERVATEEDVF